ncbi:hypothetical protein [Streptomyces mobaraensis]|uniref:Uncharacterized protein n=1 Tax=Streptomyces mobaraensis TaxID=35621 RepID=A0A5N5W5F5_STRMB|nr:hypothetical protein [Streptomyces mobaraensis]KAB7839499.1 hypothetical protein FRZ00_21410 [Streptomyces mobaraensis]
MMATGTARTKRDRMLRARFLTVLTDAARERDRRQHLVPGSDCGREPAWVAHERETLLLAVNVIREQERLPEVTAWEIESVERLARGHHDYALKLALYCAELAVGERGRR